MFKIIFYILFFKIKTSEQHTAKNLINLVYYPIGFVWSHRLHQGFNKMNKIELLIYWTFTVQITFKLGCEQQTTPTNRKYYANPAQQIVNVTQIQRTKVSNVYFSFWGSRLFILCKSLMTSVWSDDIGRIINLVYKICCCVLLTSFLLKKTLKKKNNCYSPQFPIFTIPTSMLFLIFYSGSFPVPIMQGSSPVRDHARSNLGILCGPGSFAVLRSFADPYKYLEEMIATSCSPRKMYIHVWLEGGDKTVKGNLISQFAMLWNKKSISIIIIASIYFGGLSHKAMFSPRST